MFDVAWSELAVIAVVTLVAVGPKDLPKVVYEAGKWVRRARSLSREFQGAFDQMMREAELDEIRRKAEDAARAASSGKLLSDVLDPDHVMAAAFNPTLLGPDQPAAALAAAVAEAVPAPQPSLTPPGPTAVEDHDDFDDLPLNVIVPPASASPPGPNSAAVAAMPAEPRSAPEPAPATNVATATATETANSANATSDGRAGGE